MVRALLSGNLNLLSFFLMLIGYALILLVALPVHELAHGFVAYKLGDRTAKACGRLTLNPLAHLDIWGTAMIVLFGIGYAKPVPVNPYNFRNPKAGMALTALAGPVSNLLMAALSVGLFRVLYLLIPSAVIISWAWWLLVSTFAGVNLGLAVFNLLPIPPLDGYRILSLILPDRWIYTIEQYQNYVMTGMLLLVASGAFSVPIAFLSNWLEQLLSLLFGFGRYLFAGYLA